MPLRAHLPALRPSRVIATALAALLLAPIVTSSGRAFGSLSGSGAEDCAKPSTALVATSDDAAAAVADAPEGSVICFAAGVHRLTAPLAPKRGQVLVGVRGAVLSGARPLKAWTAQDGLWYAAGALPADYTDPGLVLCEDEVARPCAKAEVLFDGRRQLKRVMSREAVTSGTFYADYGTGRVWVGADPTGRTLEISRTRAAITSRADDVQVLNLVVEKFATLSQRGAVEDYGDRWTIASNEVRFNHGVGVKVVATSTAVRSNYLHHNGQVGLTAWRSEHLQVTGNRIAANNTDGFWINDGENGGIKITNSSGASVSRNRVADNNGLGIWMDIDDADMTIADNYVDRNASDGIRYEISYRGTITGNTLVGNGHARGRGVNGYLGEGGAITVNTSSGVEVRDNRLVGNDKGVALVAADRGAGERGTWDLRDVVVTGNTIELAQGAENGLVQYRGDPSYFTGRGNAFRGNTYVLTGQEPGAKVMRGLSGNLEDVSSWQQQLSWDTSGSGASVTTIASQITSPPPVLAVGPRRLAATVSPG